MSGTLYILSAPSGAGKTCLVKTLLSLVPNLALSVSYTTRAPRSSEVNGEDYHFVSVETFKKMEAEGEFLETAHIYGNYYGTSKKDIQERLSHSDVILEIDWQGAQQIASLAIGSVVSIFVLPPSVEELEIRLRERGQDDETIIAQRMKSAKSEILHVTDYQFVIINEHFETAVDDLLSIVRANRLTFSAQRDQLKNLIPSIK